MCEELNPSAHYLLLSPEFEQLTFPNFRPYQELSPREIREIEKNSELFLASQRDEKIEIAEKQKREQIEHLSNTTDLEKKRLEEEELMSVVRASSSQEQERIQKEFEIKKAALDNHYQEQLTKIEEIYTQAIKAVPEWHQHELNELNTRADKLIALKENNKRRFNELIDTFQDLKSKFDI